MEHLSDGVRYVLTVAAIAMLVVCLGIGLISILRGK